MIKVLYDNQIFNLQKFGGISRYFTELIAGVHNSDEATCFPKRFFSGNIHLRNNHLTYLNVLSDCSNYRGRTRVNNYVRRRENNAINHRLKSGGFDIFHPTYYDANILEHVPHGKPFVITIHDMIFELYYDHQYKKISEETRVKRLLIPRADHIIAVSHNTKADILKFFPQVDENKISVIYHGSSFSKSVGNTSIRLPSKYILYVGNRGDYKNFMWCLQTISGFLKTHGLKLVCAGGGRFSDSELNYFRNNDLIDKVVYMEIPGDDILKAIYSKAVALIFPSLYEGFGIPILEAFSCGCPVIVPDSTCFPEIAQSAALYYEENNSDSLLKQLSNLLHSSQLSEDMKERGFNRLKFFSWAKTVDQHIHLYKQLTSHDS